MRTYAGLLRRPGALMLVGSGLLSRFPVAVVDVALVLLVTSLEYSFAVAGAVSGVFALTQAVGAPLLGRLADRLGQRKVVAPAAVIHAALVGVVVLLAQAQVPSLLLLGVTALSGFFVGSIGSLTRARWDAVLLDDEAALKSAFSLEGVLDEVVMLTAPVLVALLAASASPSLAVLAVAVLGLAGATLFVLTPGAAVVHEAEPGAPGVMNPSVLALMAVSLMLGSFFSAVDLSAVATATAADQRALVGVLLAALAAGSLVGGLVYGARTWRMASRDQAIISAAALAVGAGLLSSATSLWVVGVLALVSGLAVSPVMIATKTLARSLVGRHQVGEVLSWTSSAGVLGFAVGSFSSGLAVESVGAPGGYLVASGSALAAALVLVLARRGLPREG